MATEKIVLAQLDLDVKSLLAATAQSKEAIAKLTQEIKLCKEAGKEFSQEYSSLASDLQSVTQALKTQEQALAANAAAMQSLISGQQNFNASQQAATTNLQQTTTAVAGQTKTFSDYKQQLIDSFQSINVFNGGLGALRDRTREAGGVMPLLTNAFSGMTGGIKGMGAAIKANPLGMFLTLVAPIVEELKKFAPLTNAVEQAMAGLEPVLNLVTAPLKYLAEGITWVISGLTNMAASMSDTVEESVKLKEAQQDLATQMALQDVAHEKARQQMDALKKKSEDLTLTELERVAALKELAEVETKNFNERKKNATQAYDIAAGNLKAAKGLSTQEINMLENGTAAQIQELAKKKAISNEELDVLQKAQVEKLGFVTQEIEMKERQEAAINGVVSGLIKKSQDQKLSENERIKALEDAAKIEQGLLNNRKQKAEEEYNVQLSFFLLKKDVDLAEVNMLIEQGDAYKGKADLIARLSKDEVASLQKALDKKKEIANQELKQQQEQETAKDQILADSAAKRKAEADAKKQEEKSRLGEYAQKLKLELQLYEEQEKGKTRTYEQEVAYQNTIRQKQEAVVRAEYAASEKKYNDGITREIALRQIQNDSEQKMHDLAMANAEKKHNAVLDANKALLENNQNLNNEIVNQEVERLKTVAKAEEEYLKAQLDNKVIAIEEYNAKITKLDKTTREEQNTIKQQYEEQKNAVLLEELEAKKTKKAEDFLADLAISQEQDDLKRSQELANVNLTKQEIDEVNARYDKAAQDREKSKNDFIINQRESLYETIKGLFSKESKIGKAIAVAEITNNTAKLAGEAFQEAANYATNPVTIPLAINAAIQGGIIVATGAAQIKKTVSAKLEQGGLVSVGGNRHSNGGTLFTGADGTRFEAEQGELIGVMNRNAAAHFMAFNNAFPAGGGAGTPNYFASGGIVSREMASPGLNVDELAAKIAAANASLPPPVVAVQDIINQGNSYVQVRDAANF